MVTIGISVERRLPRNRKITTMTMSGRLEQRLLDLLDRGADELGGVIGDGRVDARRQLALDVRECFAHVVDHRQRVCRRRRIDADEHGLQPVEHGGGIGALGPELDAGDIVEPNQRVAACHDDQLAERRRVVERGLGVDAWSARSRPSPGRRPWRNCWWRARCARRGA